MRHLLIIFCLFFGWQMAVAQSVAQESTVEFHKQKRGKVAMVKRHDNGQIAQTGWYKYNIPHGSWACFNEKGQLTTQATYDRGFKHGTWKFWDTEGKLLFEIEYHYGKLVTARQYNFSGDVVASK